MLRLYDFLESGNGYKVRLLLAQLALAYEFIELDILKGETRTAEFLARNPNGKIPLLELEDGTFLSESNAILYHLSQGTPYWPGNPLAQARVLQWMFLEQHNHEPTIAEARFWLHFLEMTDERQVQLAQKAGSGPGSPQTDGGSSVGSRVHGRGQLHHRRHFVICVHACRR